MVQTGLHVVHQTLAQKWNEQNDITKTFSTKFKSVLNTAVAAPVDRSSDGSPEWVAAVTDDGDKYWLNKHTGETSWTPPLRPGENPWTALKDEEGDTVSSSAPVAAAYRSQQTPPSRCALLCAVLLQPGNAGDQLGNTAGLQ